MKARQILLLLCAAALVLVPGSGTMAGPDAMRVTVNDHDIAFDVPPVVMAGRTLVPVRAVLEALGATVSWDEATRSITILRGYRRIVMVVGVATALVDDRWVNLDVPPQIIQGRTLVPLRFISEGLGAAVTWDEASRTVGIRVGSAGDAREAWSVPPAASPAPPAESPLRVLVNGQTVQLGMYQAISATGYTMVPLPPILTALNVPMRWDTRTGTLTASFPDVTLLLTAGSGTAILGGRPVPLATPAEFTGGTLLVPLTFLTNDLARLADPAQWDTATQTLHLSLPTAGVAAGKADPGVPAVSARKSTGPWRWVPGVMTQPLPPQASRVRLTLPVSMDKIIFAPTSGHALSGFGIHEGGHVEGLDHIWLSIRAGTQVGSWADGVVTDIRPSGDVELGELAVTIDYGDGLRGFHTEVARTLVKVGERVKAGQPVAVGMSFAPGIESAEFALMDDNRRSEDDESALAGFVSPYDYLEDSSRQALIQAYTERVVQPYLAKGRPVGYNTPWEPYLTNRIGLHPANRGTLVGEWLLQGCPGIGGYPDILTFLTVDNPYLKGNRLSAADEHGDAGARRGNWEADATAGRVRLVFAGSTQYGIFRLDETGPRAVLKLEYREGSYPLGFSDQAATYVERSTRQRLKDRESIMPAGLSCENQ